MKYFAIAIIYTAFFGLIFGATYVTGSAWCLWALILTPSVNDTGMAGPVKQVDKQLKKY